MPPSGPSLSRTARAGKLALDLAVIVGGNIAMFYILKHILNRMDPNYQKKLEAKKDSDAKLGKLSRGSAIKASLNEYEQQIATELILPEQIDVDFDSIGGLDHIIDSLQESVIAPLCHPGLFQNTSGLLGAPKGVLLYGPPGTGKTMLAKALAKESGATFINMHVSTLTNKWFGESNKLVSALFSLARRLQPAIVFIDEIDSFMRERGTGDHEVTGMMKAEFMTLWDGLTSSTDRIMILGATNRPNDIDSAILRRMPKRYAVPLPGAAQRQKILTIMLRDTRLDPQKFNMAEIVRRSEGQSGSDLKELCRNAAMIPVRQFLKTKEGRESMRLAKSGNLSGLTSGVATPDPSMPGANGDASSSSSSSSSKKDSFTAPTQPLTGSSSSSIQLRPLRTDDFFRSDEESIIPQGDEAEYNKTTGRRVRGGPHKVEAEKEVWQDLD